MDRTPDYTNAVFGNGLLFDHIVEYLGIPDLKILRQTCKLLYSKVNGHRKFISSLRLTISDETIRENGMCDSITWQNVSIVVSRTSGQHLRNIRTDCIQDLEILHPTTKDLTQLTTDKNSRFVLYVLLEGRQFPNLRSITLDLNLMCYDFPMAAMASVVVGTVKEFRLRGAGLHDNQFCPTGEEGRTAEKNLEMLGGLSWKLHSFVMQGLHLSQRISIAVGAIPASSASTLQELELCSVGLTKHIHGVRFPLLKSVGLEIEDRFGEYDLAEFLDLQPQLEAIEINCQQLYTNRKHDPSVLEAIRRSCSSELHTLRLRGAVWLRSFPDFESWAFIRDLPRLKNVTICGMCINRADNMVAEILNYLPSGTQSLEFDKVKFDIVPQSTAIAALTGFTNLVQLKLSTPRGVNCVSPINDAILQAICLTLIKLRVLHFGSAEVTDFGLTGERVNYNSGISLRNLKGLQDLDISRCEGITENGILTAVQFPELRNLKLGTQISKSALVQIASRNTSLEDVAFASIYEFGRDGASFDEYFRGLFSSVMAVNPRLTRIHSLYQPVGGAVSDDVICRPSYGVSANLANTTTFSHVRNTMKIVKPTKGEVPAYEAYEYNYTYYYDLPN